MPSNPTRRGTRAALVGKLKSFLPRPLTYPNHTQYEAASLGQIRAFESLERPARVSDGGEEQRRISAPRQLEVLPDLDSDPTHQKTSKDYAQIPPPGESGTGFGEFWRCLQAGLVSRDLRKSRRRGSIAGDDLSHFSRDLWRPLEPSGARATSPNSGETDFFADAQADSDDLALREYHRPTPLTTSPADEDRPPSSSRTLSSTSPKPPSPSVALPADEHLAHQFMPIPDRGASRTTDVSPPAQTSSSTSDPSSKAVVSSSKTSSIVTWDSRCAATTLKNERCKRRADGGSDVCRQHKGISRKVTNTPSGIPQYHNDLETSSDDAVSATPTLNSRCVAITLQGERCKRRADGASDVCHQHRGTSRKVINSRCEATISYPRVGEGKVDGENEITGL